MIHLLFEHPVALYFTSWVLQASLQNQRFSSGGKCSTTPSGCSCSTLYLCIFQKKKKNRTASFFKRGLLLLLLPLFSKGDLYAYTVPKALSTPSTPKTVHKPAYKVQSQWRSSFMASTDFGHSQGPWPHREPVAASGRLSRLCPEPSALAPDPVQRQGEWFLCHTGERRNPVGDLSEDIKSQRAWEHPFRSSILILWGTQDTCRVCHNCRWQLQGRAKNCHSKLMGPELLRKPLTAAGLGGFFSQSVIVGLYLLCNGFTGASFA